MTDEGRLELDELLERLPHRYPFLLIDRVLESKPGTSIVAIKNVTVNEPFFAGHFPSFPVMPGVLVVEAMAQAGGVLAWESADKAERDAIPYLVGVEKARFKQPVRPGDRLVLRVTLLAKRRGLWRFDCHAEVDGVLAAQAEILIAAGKKR